MSEFKSGLSLLAVMLCVPILSGCPGKSETLPPVRPQPILLVPPLPSEAKQLPAPAWCSPSCGEAQRKRRQTWDQRLMKLVPEGSSANDSTPTSNAPPPN